MLDALSSGRKKCLEGHLKHHLIRFVLVKLKKTNHFYCQVESAKRKKEQRMMKVFTDETGSA